MKSHSEQLTVIFVYGTLKRHDCRNYLLKDSIFVGETVTDPNYRLFNLGSYPGLIESVAGQGVCIEGELYAVTPECLLRLDEEEGVSEQLYERHKIQLQPPHAQVKAQTYYYLGSTNQAEEIGTRWEVASTE